MSDSAQYLTALKEVFYVNEEATPDKKYLQKEFLTKGISEKLQYESMWIDLIDSLKQNRTLRVKDMSGAGEVNAFTGTLSYDNFTKGIIFAVSFPFRLFGFYYKRTTDADNTGTFEEEFSYEPFDNEMMEVMSYLKILLIDKFPNFKQFDNSVATLKLEQIFISGKLFHNLDLWKTILSTYSQGMM